MDIRIRTYCIYPNVATYPHGHFQGVCDTPLRTIGQNADIPIFIFDLRGHVIPTLVGDSTAYALIIRRNFSTSRRIIW